MKRSIKRKIQNSMFLANILTLMITFAIFSFALYGSIGPLSSYVTKSVADDFVKKYEKSEIDATNKNPSQQFFEELTLDQVIANLNEIISKKEESLSNDMMMNVDGGNEAAITAKDENDYKKIFIIVKEVYDDSNQFSFNINMVQIDVVIGEHVLMIPTERTVVVGLGMEEFQKADNSIMILDDEGIKVGEVLVRMEPVLVIFIEVFFISMLVVLSLFSMLIVKLVSKILTKGIMRPLNQVNNQLKLMASNEIEELSTFQLALKKPPIEIADMISYSNQVIDKFKHFGEILENQNEELHMQNDELLHNRVLIETQQNQLIQSEKLASIGQISAAVVHEINTPIGAIKSNAQMMDMMINQLTAETDIEKIHKKTEMIKTTNEMVISASDRVIQIVKSIKNFSRIDQSAFKEADLHEAIDSVLLLTSNMWKSRITITRHFGAIPLVNCYIGLINQVIMNLVVNAIDAIEATGEITITTGTLEDEVFIKVADTGAGIASENLNRVFVQGFTTKPVGKGSGLGLALSKDIMDKHYGRIEVKSEMELGSEFTVFIPLKAPDKSM